MKGKKLMIAIIHDGQTRWRTRTLLCVSALALVGMSTGLGAPPPEPLPPPEYSFDAFSPTVLAGIVHASDVLVLDFPHPMVGIPGPVLGLLSPADDLDAFSLANTTLPAWQTFSMLFSVDRATTGLLPPDPELYTLGRPFNATDQAMRGHAAGDQYMTTVLFTRAGAPPCGRLAPNNSLVRNNFDEGGTDFSADPPTHANQTTGPTSEDNVDATDDLDEGSGSRSVFGLYFSATAESPSLWETLPGSDTPSGAHVFYWMSDGRGSGDTMLFARFEDLQLMQMDDIDGLVIFDENENGMFDGTDQMLFSLTPMSPSLATIPGASSSGAGADIFTIRPGQGPMLFVPADLMGLGAPSDNIDALDYFPCDDPLDCALRHSIRMLRGDMDCDGDVDFDDINPFVLALGGEAGYQAAWPDCFWINGDCDWDGDVDFDDINTFVLLMGS